MTPISTAPQSAAGPKLLRTPFYDLHVSHSAKMVDFAGWEMPMHYGSIIDEHKQVRSSGGLFDVSHMGRLRFTGRDARRFLDHVCTRQIHGMENGQARYSMICNDRGGVRDDVLVYRIDDDSEYLMVCNASNRLKLLEHFAAVKGGMVFKLKDETESTAMIAIQGPKVMELLAKFSSEIPLLKRYRFTTKNILVARILVSRTGYTGEDGVEVILPAAFAPKAVKLMLDNLGDDDAVVKPAGLGARDSLRLEAGMSLYGHEITEDIDPVSAGLDFAIKYGKADDDPTVGRFIGQDAIEKIKTTGPKRKLVGLALDGRRAARQGMPVFSDAHEIGVITSGCLSPTLDRSIAMAYVESALSTVGTAVQVDLGRQRAAANVVALPFYKGE